MSSFLSYRFSKISDRWKNNEERLPVLGLLLLWRLPNHHTTKQLCRPTHDESTVNGIVYCTWYWLSKEVSRHWVVSAIHCLRWRYCTKRSAHPVLFDLFMLFKIRQEKITLFGLPKSTAVNQTRKKREKLLTRMTKISWKKGDLKQRGMLRLVLIRTLTWRMIKFFGAARE